MQRVNDAITISFGLSAPSEARAEAASVISGETVTA
jgi:hypothetical protein